MQNELKENILYLFEKDQNYIQLISTDRGLILSIADYFTFEVENAKWDKRYINKVWDGKIRLVDMRTQTIYRGLLKKIIKFCEDNNIDYIIDNDLKKDLDLLTSESEIEKYIQSIQDNLLYEPKFYQLNAIKHILLNKRSTIISPTSSGKSFVMYLVIRYLIDNGIITGQILVTVPTVDLVNQLSEEFDKYDQQYNINQHLHKIYSGKEKVSNKKILVSTWQSLYSMSRDYFESIETIISDECHLCKAKSLKYIFESCKNAWIRTGVTGTLNGINYDELIIEGLAGLKHSVITTAELMKLGDVSQLNIQGLILDYSPEEKKLIAQQHSKYQDELSYIKEHRKRTRFIALVCSKIIPKNENTLILTTYVDHAKELYNELKSLSMNVSIVTGEVKTEERTKTRQETEHREGVIIIATYGVYSTGISIKNLQNMIFATGSKSIIRVLQSIGRGLRLDGKKNKVTVFDIVDDFSFNSRQNYLLKHFIERLKIYKKSGFNVKTKRLNISK